MVLRPSYFILIATAAVPSCGDRQPSLTASAATAAVEHVARAGAALAAGDTQTAIDAYRKAGEALARSGQTLAIGSLDQTVQLLKEMEAVPGEKPIGLLEQFGCKALACKAGDDTLTALYEHADGLVVVAATNVEDHARAKPVIRSHGGVHVVSWFRPCRGFSCYVQGLFTTDEAAQQAAAWYAQAGRLPFPSAYLARATDPPKRYRLKLQ